MKHGISLMILPILLLLPGAGLAAERPDELAVEVQIDNSSYSWFGDVRVSALVSFEGAPVADCDSVIAICPANTGVRALLRDDGAPPDLVSGDGTYTGIFRVGGELGEARPTGSYRVEVAAYRAEQSGSAHSSYFTLYSVRRWTGITTGWASDPNDQYTVFQVQPAGELWHHRIIDLGLVRSSAVTDALIRIPVLPFENVIENVSVSGGGVSDIEVQGNVIQFSCDFTQQSVQRVDVEFDAASDLAALLIDRYHTGDMGQRNFRNGYLVWNRYIHTGILGSDYSYPHGPGCVVDLHVTDLASGAPHTVDCMERVAVHLDDMAQNDGSGTYPSNVKWTGDALDWLDSADLEQMSFVMHSGGAYGLADRIAVTKTVQLFADSRMFRHEYVVRNIDDSSHDFDLVWGREQWLYGSAPGSDRDEDDRGLLPNDPAAYGGEHGFTAAELDGNWFGAYDLSSYYAIAVLFPNRSAQLMPSFAYFLCDPPLGNFTGEYPIEPWGSCLDMGNLFFEKRLGDLGSDESTACEFYQWGGYGADRTALTDLLWRDAVLLSGEPLVLDFDPRGDEVPVSSAIEICFNQAMNHASSEAALIITPEPPQGGVYQWSEGDTRLRFQPASLLMAETEYSVLVLRTAMASDGTPLATEAQWSFRTGSELTDVVAADVGQGRLRFSGPSRNPFRGSTRIGFTLPVAGDVRLAVYDVGGRLVDVLTAGVRDAGLHELSWRGVDAGGRPLPAGVYFCCLESGAERLVRKLVFLR